RTVLILRTPDASIIALFLVLVALLRLDHANGSARQYATGECWLIHQDQYIDRIAIVSFGRGNESEVIGKRHPGWQYLLEFEDVLVRIKTTAYCVCLSESPSRHEASAY